MTAQTPPTDLDGTDHKQDSIRIDATPEQVYAVVSDVTRTGEWSPVCKACWWTDEHGEPSDPPEGGPVAGTWFAGRNEIPDRTWETRSLVIEAAPGRAFRWQIYGRLVTWGYRLEPDGDADGAGTLLTETWDLNQATKDMFAEKYGERAEEALDGRRRDARDGIPATLRTIKAIVEGQNGPA